MESKKRTLLVRERALAIIMEGPISRSELTKRLGEKSENFVGRVVGQLRRHGHPIYSVGGSVEWKYEYGKLKVWDG